MSDIFIEQLVKKKQSTKDKGIVIALFILAVIASAIFSLILSSGFFPIILVLSFGAAFYFSSYFRNTEYEYIFTNTELDIDAIYNRQKRKTVASIDLKNCIVITYLDNDEYKAKYSNNIKTDDYSSGSHPENAYYLITQVNGTMQKIIFEPNEKLVNAMEQKIGRRIFIKKP